MVDNVYEHLIWIAGTILSLWSAILVWATRQIRSMYRDIDEERSTLRRWQHLRDLEKRQNAKWQ